jgi:hypothetical protein
MRRLLLLSLLCLSACGLTGRSSGFDYDALRGGMTEAETLSRHHGVTWKCGEPADALRHYGEEVCDAEKVPLGDTTAAELAYFFRDGKLTSAHIEYATEGFDAIAKELDGKYKRVDYGLAAGHFAWGVKDGVALSSSRDQRHGHAFVLWFSSAEAEQYKP